MKKLLALALTAVMLMAPAAVVAETEETVWAYGALPLNSEALGVGTIYYTKSYYELEGIINPLNPEYAPYTAEEIAAIVDGAVADAEGYRFDAPENALIGMSVFGNPELVYWYDAENAAVITSHADPLTLNAETGVFTDAEGNAVASPIAAE